MKRLLESYLGLSAIGCLTVACSRAPDEPMPAAASVGTTVPAKAPLAWTVPPGWSTQKTAAHGRNRAKYEIAPVGNDAHPAELLVQYLGRGPQADLDRAFERWLALFEDRQAASNSPRMTRVGELTIEVREVAGTYKFPMGPPVGPRGAAVAHVLKPGWRGLAAGVDTPHRGRWWFRLVGPDDTVTAARSGFDDLLRSLR